MVDSDQLWLADDRRLIDGQLHDHTMASRRSRRCGGRAVLSPPPAERAGVHLRPGFRAGFGRSRQPGRFPGGWRPVVELLSADRAGARNGVPAIGLSAGFPGQAGLVDRALENEAVPSMPRGLQPSCTFAATASLTQAAHRFSQKDNPGRCDKPQVAHPSSGFWTSYDPTIMRFQHQNGGT